MDVAAMTPRRTMDGPVKEGQGSVAALHVPSWQRLGVRVGVELARVNLGGLSGGLHSRCAALRGSGRRIAQAMEAGRLASLRLAAAGTRAMVLARRKSRSAACVGRSVEGAQTTKARCKPQWLGVTQNRSNRSHERSSESGHQGMDARYKQA